MCVGGFLPLTLPSKPLLGVERGQTPPCCLGRWGAGAVGLGTLTVTPPCCSAPCPRGLNHGLGVGSPPLTRLYTESIGASPTMRVGGDPPPITRSPCCQGNPTWRRWSLMQDV